MVNRQTPQEASREDDDRSDLFEIDLFGLAKAILKRWKLCAGIVGGVTADQLAPQDNINRASTVTILDRAISTYADKAGATVKADGKAAVITPEVNEVVVKSARNIPGVVTSPAKLINVYDLLNAKTLVIDKDALAVIEEVFA